MRLRVFASFFALVALSGALLCNASEPGIDSERPLSAMTPLEIVQRLSGPAGQVWTCQTTWTNGLVFWETDRFEQIGTYPWIHGMVRPSGTERGPYYDFYLGYVGAHWIFIEVEPARGTYFVARSDGDKLEGNWQIVYPWKLPGYDVRFGNALLIKYPDLTQLCTPSAVAPSAAMSGATASAPARATPGQTPEPSATLSCSTTSLLLGYAAPAGNETLEVFKPQQNVPWWQGEDKIGNQVVYEYNVFNIATEKGPQRISVLINPSRGSYAIASSYATQTINFSAWVVRYPKIEPGFSFKDVDFIRNQTGKEDLPRSFTVIFKDGYQQCAIPGSGANPATTTP